MRGKAFVTPLCDLLGLEIGNGQQLRVNLSGGVVRLRAIQEIAAGSDQHDHQQTGRHQSPECPGSAAVQVVHWKAGRHWTSFGP